MEIKTYKDLFVWQKSMELCRGIYTIIKQLPKEETYALSDQIKRSAVSIPSNIAEGQARGTTKEYIHFLSIAMGSNAELNTQLILCEMIGYLSHEQLINIFELVDEIHKMLFSLRQQLIKKSAEQI